MKLISSTQKEFLDSNLEAQFIFGARLVAYPRTDRWDNENNRLQSIKANGDLMFIQRLGNLHNLKVTNG